MAALYSGLIYVNALNNPYVYDDVRTIQGNTSLDDLRAFKRIVLRESMRPLVNLSYALDRAVWPWQLVGHHLTSVLLHVLNVLLVFQLAWSAVSDQRSHAPPGVAERVSPQVVAFMAASLFGLHPMMTEAVGYISGRSEVLYGCFFLLALLAARRWMIGDGAKWMVLGAGLWTAALMSKEVAVFWPIVASLYDRYVLGSPEADWRRRFVRVYMPMLALTVVAGALRIGILVLVENPGEAHIMWQFIPVELVVWFKYFRLLLLPAGQTIFHQIEPIHSPFDSALLAAIAWIAVWVGLGLRPAPAERASGARAVLVHPAARSLVDARVARSRRADGRASGVPGSGRAVSRSRAWGSGGRGPSSTNAPRGHGCCSAA
jgi:hypothetical protein